MGDENETCCTGLTATNYSWMSTRRECTGGENSSFVCARCGDGSCGTGENKCNCPKDCNITCLDSEEERDYFTTGKITVKSQVITDTCNKNRTLREYYCDGNLSAFEDYECPRHYGCYFGRCINVTVPCVKKGQVAQIWPGYACCSGLRQVYPTDPDTCEIVPGSFVCIICGDGDCGAGENNCTCIEDCS